MQFHVSMPTRPASRASVLVASVLGYVSHNWIVWQARRRQRATVRILQGLSDRTLKDIGVDRSRIEAIAATCSDERRRRGAARDFHLS